MALIKGKQIAANTITGGATGNLALTTVTYQNVNASIMARPGVAPGDHWAAQSVQIKNLSPGSVGTDAVNLDQLNAVVGGLSWKMPVAAATTAPLTDPYLATATTLTRVGNGALLASDIDGQTPVANIRVLIKDEAGALERNNGIYLITDVGSAGTPWVLTRTSDADTVAELIGAVVAVAEGFTPGSEDDTVWLQTYPTTILGADPVAFTSFGQYVGGNGIAITGNSIAVDLAALAAGTTNAAVGGLKFSAGNLSFAIASAGASVGGLQVVAGGSNGELQVFADTARSVTLTAAGVGVNIAATAGGIGNAGDGGLRHTAGGISALLADTLEIKAGLGNGINAATPVKVDLNIATAGTFTTEYAGPLATISNTPVVNSVVTVRVNGVSYPVGDGTPDGTVANPIGFYFSNDSGVTACTLNGGLNPVVASSELYLADTDGTNVPIFDMDPTDHIDLEYDAFQ